MRDEQKQLLQQISAGLEAHEPQTLARWLNEQRSSDIAEVAELLDNEQRRAVFDVLDKPLSAEVLEKVNEAIRAEIFDLLREDEIKDIVAELDLDDAADLLAELPEEISQKVIISIKPADAAKIRKLMSYSEDSAGGILGVSQ